MSHILIVFFVSVGALVAQETAFPLTARLQSKVPAAGIAADSFYLPGSADISCFEATAAGSRFLCLSDSGTVLEWTAANRIRQAASGFTGPLRAKAAEDGSLYVLDVGRGTLSLVAPNGTVTRILGAGSDRIVKPQMDPQSFDLPFFVLTRDYYTNFTQLGIDAQGNLYLVVLHEEVSNSAPTRRSFWIFRLENKGATMSLYYDGSAAMTGKTALPELTSVTMDAQRTMFFAMDGQISRLTGTSNYTEFRGGVFQPLVNNPARSVAFASNGEVLIQSFNGNLYRLGFAELRTDFNLVGFLNGPIARAGSQAVGFDLGENRLVRYEPDATRIYVAREIGRLLRNVPVLGNSAFRPAFDNPIGVSTDNQNQVFVTEGEDGSVYRIANNGVLTRVTRTIFSPDSTTPYRFTSDMIAVDQMPYPVVATANDISGRLYLVDRDCNFYIQQSPTSVRRAARLTVDKGCAQASMIIDSGGRVLIGAHAQGEIHAASGDPMGGDYVFARIYSGGLLQSMSMMASGELLVLEGRESSTWTLRRFNPTTRAVVTLRLDDALRSNTNIRLSSAAVDATGRILAVSCCTAGASSEAGRRFLVALQIGPGDVLSGQARPIVFFDEPGQAPSAVFSHARGALLRTNLNRIYLLEAPQFRSSSAVALPNRNTWTYQPDAGTQEYAIPVNPVYGPTAFRTRMTCDRGFEKWVRVGPAAAVAPTQLRLALDTLNAPSRAASCKIDLLATDTTRVMSTTTVDMVPDPVRLAAIPPLSLLGQLQPFSVDPTAAATAKQIRMLNNSPETVTVNLNGTLPEGIVVTPAALTLDPKQGGDFTVTLTPAMLPRQQYRVPLRAVCTPCSGNGVEIDLSFQISGRTTSIDLSAEAVMLTPRSAARVAAASLVVNGIEESDIASSIDFGTVAPWFTLEKAATVRGEDGSLAIEYEIVLASSGLPVRPASNVVTFSSRSMAGLSRRFLTVFYFPEGFTAQRLFEAGIAGASVNLATARSATVRIPIFSRAAAPTAYSSYMLGNETGVVTVPSTQGVVGVGAGEIELEVTRDGAGGAAETKDVVLLFANGEKLVITVNAVTSAQVSASAKGRREIGACANPKLLLTPREPGLPFTVVRNVGLRFRVELKDECNQLVNASDKAQLRFSVEPANGTNTVTSTGNGVWDIFWKPERVQENVVAKLIAVRGVSEREIYAGTVTLNGRVADSQVPSLRSFSVRDAISFEEKSFTAPGAFISIFGENLAQSEKLGFDTPGTFPTDLAGVQVQFNGKPAPLLYVSPGQVNLQVPYDLQFTEYRMVIRRGDLVSTPSSLSVGSASPAVATLDGSGKGQGQIYRVAPDVEAGFATAANAVRPGESILIVATGLGPTNPLVDEGKAVVTESRAGAIGDVRVRIGNALATDVSAWLVPGQIGIYFVSAIVPADAPTGDAVPVVLSANGVESQLVTMAVQAAVTPSARRVR